MHSSSVTAALKRLEDWAEVNESLPQQEQLRAMRTMNDSIGLTPEVVDVLAQEMAESGIAWKMPLDLACSLVTYGASIVLTAIQIERDDEALAAAR
jgi:hypothetical protein